MSKIIILNGPIGCGKDTVGQAFAEREGFEFTSFKEPMFRIAASTMGYSYDDFLEMYQNREWKESPNSQLGGRTVRELMIHISEVYVKPFLGQDYFGQQALRYINQRPWQSDFIFGDGGFPAEINVLAEAGHEVVLVHMYRDGCTFEGDSRSYVLTNAVPRIDTLTNNGTVEDAVDALGRILDSYEDQRRSGRADEIEPEQPAIRPTRRNAAPRYQASASFVRGGSIASTLRRAAEASSGGNFGWQISDNSVRRGSELPELFGERTSPDSDERPDGVGGFTLASAPTEVWVNEAQSVSEDIAG